MREISKSGLIQSDLHISQKLKEYKNKNILKIFLIAFIIIINLLKTTKNDFKLHNAR